MDRRFPHLLLHGIGRDLGQKVTEGAFSMRIWIRVKTKFNGLN